MEQMKDIGVPSAQEGDGLEGDAPAPMLGQPGNDPGSMLQNLGDDGMPRIDLPMHGGDGIMFPNHMQNQNFALFQGLSLGGGANGAVFPNADNMIIPDQQMMGFNGGALPPQTANGNISADEIALYDRQIRLWGMQAQKKIRGANILLVTMKGLANEIAKNLVLAGIGSLTIMDDQLVTERDLGAQFFLTQEHVGRNRAEAAAENVRKLNPRVQVYADTRGIMTQGPSYFAPFDVVVATDLNPTALAFVNTATRLHNRQFYAAGTHGFYGYIFCDLIEHDYVLQRKKANVATKIGQETRTRSVIDVKTKKEGSETIEMVTKRELYSTWDLASETSFLESEYRNSKRRLKAVTPALSCFRALWGFQALHNRDPNHNHHDLESFTKSATHKHQSLGLPAETLRSDFLRSFLQNIGSEIAPVTAILGGQLAQDVINVLGQSQPPIQNMVIFDGNAMQGDMYPLHPEGKLGRAQLDMHQMGIVTDPGMPMVTPDMFAQMQNAAVPSL